ncbi:hypothetical protein CEXT_279221 [Caerostris extrusa]|uniref:CRAL-TRIO domain-containing protein n=1 Tax=Caerostris extrusa TaxID=172846 RepID=A0AAV4VCK2_CAEEX|nr:hypothetical protein CEXT_279221 [Caerostris extrusa]
MKTQNSVDFQFGIDCKPPNDILGDFSLMGRPTLLKLGLTREVELHDTPDRRAQGLQMKELVKNDKHTKNIEFEDEFLLQYLRVRKYNVARAFTQLKALVALKKKHPLMFTNFSYDKTVKTTIDSWGISSRGVKRAAILYLLQSLREPMTQINGFKIIFDLKSNPLKHLKYCTPENIYLIYHGSQDCIAGRYKEFHAVNLSVTFKAVWFLIKPFLTDKIKKASFFTQHSRSSLEPFPKAVLPKQYGGDLENYDMSSWLKKAMAPEKLAALGGRPKK